MITELKLQPNKQIYVPLERISLNGPIDGEGLQIAHLYNGPRIFCDFIRRTPIKSIINIEGKMKYASGIIIKKKLLEICRLNDTIKDFLPSDKFDNPILLIPWVINNNSEYLCKLVSGARFQVLGTLLYLHEHCSYKTYYFFFYQSFIIILQIC